MPLEAAQARIRRIYAPITISFSWTTRGMIRRPNLVDTLLSYLHPLENLQNPSH